MSGCFANVAPRTLVDAVVQVDCATGQMAQFGFGQLFGAGGQLQAALTILLTLYIGLFALRLLTGHTTLGAAALTPRMLGLGAVLTFATSWLAYQSVVWTLLASAPDQLAGILTGQTGGATLGFVHQLDGLFDAVAGLAGAGTAHASMPADAPSAGVTPVTVLWGAALILLLGTAGVLVASRVALAALLALGPMFIVMALFRGTRGLFDGWLRAAVLCALVPLFVVLLGTGTLTFLLPLIADVTRTGEVTMHAATTMLLAACVHVTVMIAAVKVAATITAAWRPSEPLRDKEPVTALERFISQGSLPGLTPAPMAAGAALAAGEGAASTPVAERMRGLFLNAGGIDAPTVLAASRRGHEVHAIQPALSFVPAGVASAMHERTRDIAARRPQGTGDKVIGR